MRFPAAIWLAVVAVCSGPMLASTRADAETAGKQRRIVAIGADVTETLYALGVERDIVAVDSTSQFPPSALTEKANIGYMRALSPEGVLSVAGTLIIASDKAGPPDVVKTLKSSTRYAEVGDGSHPEAVPDKIRKIAEVVDVRESGERLARRVEADLKQLADDRKQITRPQRALFVLNMQGGRFVVGGAGTGADAMLALAGIENAASDLNGYKPIGEEALLSMRPDLVLVMKAAGTHDTGDAARNPSLLATPAGRDKRIIAVDGGYLLSFGPRVAEIARDLMQTAYSARGSEKVR